MSTTRNRVIPTTVILLLVITSVWLAPELMYRISYAQQRGALEADTEQLKGLEGVSQTFRLVAKTVQPAVVNISVRSQQKLTSAQREPRRRRSQEEDLFRRFFGEDNPHFYFRDRNQGQPWPRQRIREGLGSGVIISADGHILTNAHVVDEFEAEEITVTLADGRVFSAERVVGVDRKSDLAVVQIESDQLHYVTLGNSDDVEVGDWVLAIGSPLGLDQTVTHGIVSAKGRSGVVPNRDDGTYMYQDFIQTDAAINMGNSGGPLVNMRGEVIGINSVIKTTTAGNVGLGFAIPSNMAKNVVGDLIDHGKVVRGYLGIKMMTLADEHRELLGSEDVEGIFVAQVYEGTPAAEGGLQAGDVIIAVDGTTVDEASQLQNYVANLKPGSSSRFKVWRDGREHDLNIEIGEQPANMLSMGRLSIEDLNDGSEQTLDDLGLTVEDLNEFKAGELGYPFTTGVLVKEVNPRSLAHGKLNPNDVIFRVNGEIVSNVDDFIDAIQRADLSVGIFLIVRNAAKGSNMVLLRKIE